MENGDRPHEDSMLTMIERVDTHITKSGHKVRKALFKCDCGNTKIISIGLTRSGHTKSCGCLKKEKVAQRNKDRSTHGLTKHELYNTWNMMKERCYNPANSHYHIYGGSGVRVCDRWLGEEGVKNFIEDMGERPAGYQLDRINCYGNYEPENCRWVTLSEQGYNKRRDNIVGVYQSGKKWYAVITKNSKEHYLGVYDTFEEASNARIDAEMEYYGYVVSYGELLRG